MKIMVTTDSSAIQNLLTDTFIYLFNRKVKEAST